MTISNKTLLQIAGWGGFIVASTGFYLQNKIVERVRGYDYYKSALKKLRTHAGAVHFLGEPIKDRRFKLTDNENNFSDGTTAKFSIPVTGPKDRGTYYFWAEKNVDGWTITKAELDLKSKPDSRLNLQIRFGNMFVGNAKEKFSYHNTLLCLVNALKGQNITVDLRNDTYVCGQMDTVDGCMNITFSNVVYCDPQGNEFLFENLFIHGRNIRYVHIPERKSIITTIKDEFLKVQKQGPVKKPMQKSRKATKALQQHLKTVASLNI